MNAPLLYALPGPHSDGTPPRHRDSRMLRARSAPLPLIPERMRRLDAGQRVPGPARRPPGEPMVDVGSHYGTTTPQWNARS